MSRTGRVRVVALALAVATALAAGLAGIAAARPAYAADRAVAANDVRQAAPNVPAPSTAPAPTNSTAATGPGGLSQSTLAIALTSMTPAVVTPTSVLTIRGTVTNTSKTVVQNGTVRLLVHHSPLSSRNLVAQWGAGNIDDLGGRILEANADLSVDLAPGAGAAFTITAPAPRLGLRMDYAAIGITLEALGDDGSAIGTHRLGLLRSYLTWQQRLAYDPLQISWLFPLTGGPASPTGGPAGTADLATAVGSGSRLQRVLSAVAAAPKGPGVAVAIDPSLVSDLQARSGSPSGPGSQPPASGASSSATAATAATASPLATQQATIAGYLSAVHTSVSGRTIVQLPYGDPDLMGNADNHGSSLLTAAQAAAGTGATSILGKELGVTPLTDVAWPASGWTDGTTVTAAHRAGAQTFVLAASSRPPAAEVDHTPSGFAPLTSSTDSVLYDDVLSGLLGRTSSAPNTVQTVQRFLAETLATVGERPFRQRTLLVAATRSFNPQPAAAAALFAAVRAAPWIASAPLSSLRSGTTPDIVADRDAAPIPTAVRRVQLPESQVTAVREVRSLAGQLATVIAGDDGLTTVRTNALRLVGASWRGHTGTAAVRTKALRTSLNAQGAKVHILPLSTLNFLTSDGNLTLSVANDLGQAVQGIRVRVQPANGRLVVVKQAAPITVEADRRTTIKVHVHAVAGGVVPVTAQIVTPSGLLMGSPVTVQVHVRPTDTWAFWVLGVAAGLVFLVGLVRTLRRGRSRPRLQAPEVDDL